MVDDIRLSGTYNARKEFYRCMYNRYIMRRLGLKRK